VNIQIFGINKSFDTKKAQRWFKERRIKFQYVDLMQCPMSRGELKSVCSAVGLSNVINQEDPDVSIINYLANDEAKFEKLFDNQFLLKLPVVRNGKQATVGYEPTVWSNWQ